MKNDIKKTGDAVLVYLRSAIREAAKGDTTFEFKLRRWIYARLQLDEREQSKAVKQKLWDSGIRQCQACGKKFSNIEGVEIHRKDSSLEYSVENCELMHRRCHQKL